MKSHAGCIAGQVNDPVQGVAVPLRWLYPSTTTTRPERFGPYELSVALNGAVEGDQLALVVISHGGGGSSLTHRGLALSLAQCGFVVALLEHPGNNRADNSLEGTLANLENRPRHLSLAIDASFAHPLIGPALAPDKVAVIGHSMGGYTALAAAGGRPLWRQDGTGQAEVRQVAVSADPRIGALVLLAPACGWFAYPGGLAEVDLPIMLRTAEKDALAAQLHAHIVQHDERDPRKVDAGVVANAGHHAFQSPFPASMTRADFAPSQDPAGFDRIAYLHGMNEEICQFLAKTMSGTVKPATPSNIV